MTASPAIAVEGIRYTVRLPGGRELTILDSVGFEVWPGETVAIEGRSGSGKTSLLAIMGLLTRPTGGRVAIAGRQVDGMSDAARALIRNAHLGFVFQSYSLARHLTAAQNTGLPLRYGPAVRRPEARRRAAEALGLVGLGDRVRLKPRHLSGGEQQRVAIARALVRRPQVILADEPTGALDLQTGAGVARVLFDAAREQGCAIVVVTHDPQLAASCERRIYLDAGTIVRQEPA